MAFEDRYRAEKERPPDPQLRRVGRRLTKPGLWITGIGMVPLVAGILLVVLASDWAWVLGIVLIVLSLPIHGVGLGLLLGGGVAGWASKRWPFA
jgi:hypothetical protein